MDEQIKSTGDECLLITTKDNRKFFTSSKFYNELVEFANTFKARLTLVEAPKAKILDLKELASALSDAFYTSPEVEYKILEQKVKQIFYKKWDRKNTQEIKEYIRKAFIDGQIVDSKSVSNHFHDCMSLSSFGSHISKVKMILKKEGYKIDKIGVGRYQIDKFMSDLQRMDEE